MMILKQDSLPSQYLSTQIQQHTPKLKEVLKASKVHKYTKRIYTYVLP